MERFLKGKTCLMTTSDEPLMKKEGEFMLLLDQKEQIDVGTYNELEDRHLEIMKTLHQEQVKHLPPEEVEEIPVPGCCSFPTESYKSHRTRKSASSCRQTTFSHFSRLPPAVNKDKCHLCLCAEPKQKKPTLCEQHFAQEQIAKEVVAQTVRVYANDQKVSVGVRTWMHFFWGRRWAHYIRFLPLVILAYLALCAFTFVENLLTEPALGKFKAITLMNLTNQSLEESLVHKTITFVFFLISTEFLISLVCIGLFFFVHHFLIAKTLESTFQHIRSAVYAKIVILRNLATILTKDWDDWEEKILSRFLHFLIVCFYLFSYLEKCYFSQ